MTRKLYAMTPEQLARILDACKPVPYIVVGGLEPRSAQDNANFAWEELGAIYGFDYKTVKPTGTGDQFFSAEESPPQFKHDADCCTFLGRHLGNDLYFCSQGGNLPTVIARYGNEGSDYNSGLPVAHLVPALTEAKKRAIAAGILL